MEKSGYMKKSRGFCYDVPEGLMCYLENIFSFNDYPALEETSRKSGLNRCWKSPSFCNVPHKLCEKYINKAIEQKNLGITTVLLLSDLALSNQYMSKLGDVKADLWFFAGRPKFQGTKGSSPFGVFVAILMANTKGTYKFISQTSWKDAK